VGPPESFNELPEAAPPENAVRNAELPVTVPETAAADNAGAQSSAAAADSAAPPHTGDRVIALAFDDFPFPHHSAALMQTLDECGVPGTFFVIGRKVPEQRETVLQAVRAGHSVQSHTFSHRRATELKVVEIKDELRKTDRALLEETRVMPRFVRFPGGRLSLKAQQVAEDMGLVCVDPWITEVYDMGISPQEIVTRCVERARPGGLLALHDGTPATRAALPQIVRTLRDQGYRFVTVDELVE
jgi:peptidoglycan/xylan/chitin deacetylase (PgdA/CDA1 family)